jgi:replicative DNA helicase
VSDVQKRGGLAGVARILRADNGSEVTLSDLVQSGERPLVWSLDERKRMVARSASDVQSSGRSKVFTLRLASGRMAEAAENQAFMTLDGWKLLSELRIDGRLEVPRRVPEPFRQGQLGDDEVILLAHMIGDGSCVKPLYELAGGDQSGQARPDNDDVGVGANAIAID